MRRICIEVVESREPVDRISALPDEAMIEILVRLPLLDAVRTSVLAKRWRKMWHFMNKLNFDEKCDSRKYWDFVNYCMKIRRADLIRHKGLSAIDTVRLAINSSCPMTDRWMKVVGQSKIEEFDLHFYKSKYNKKFYSLRLTNLPVSLTTLRLSRINGKEHQSLSLPNLVSLSLESVQLDKEVFAGFFSSATIKNLVVKDCHLFNEAILSGSNLGVLELDGCIAPRFVVRAKNLVCLVYRKPKIEVSGYRCDLSLGRYTKLKVLSLTDVEFPVDVLERLIAIQPSLETLSLSFCRVNVMKINNQHLKHFNLRVDASNCNGLTVDIVSCNLVSLSFEGSPVVHLSLEAQNLLEANASICHKDYDSKWYDGLVRFFKELDCARNVNLSIYSEQALIFPDEVRLVSSPPFRNVKELKIAVREPLVRRGDFADSMYWMASGREADISWP